jgi:O-antigen/teichoic acid export membrane protein
MLSFAGLVPYVLGPEYVRTVEGLRWLALLPMRKALHYFFSDALTGAGHQTFRASIQAGVAIFNVPINLWLIPSYSWRGVAEATIASDALLACAMGTAVFFTLTACAEWFFGVQRQKPVWNEEYRPTVMSGIHNFLADGLEALRRHEPHCA